MTSDFDFSSAMRDISRGLFVKPVLEVYLYNAKFPHFILDFKDLGMQREPDNWFHPSTHPLWSEADLYHYLVNPGAMKMEIKEYMGTLSVTIGSVMHQFLQVCMTDAGLMPRELQVCTTCPPDNKCSEPGVLDEEAGERGHMDGVLDLSSLGVPERYRYCIWEFKTTNSRKLSRLADLDLEKYREMFPDYYAQNQSYLRMHGAEMLVVTFLAMGYPWQQKEIHVPYDPVYAQAVRSKYLRVREAVAAGDPAPCCGRLKGCQMPTVCPRRLHG